MKLTLIIVICLFQLAILSDVDAGGPKAKKAPKPQRTAAEIKAAKDKNKPPESQINAAKAKSKAEKSQARIERKEARKEQCVMGFHKWSQVNKRKKKKPKKKSPEQKSKEVKPKKKSFKEKSKEVMKKIVPGSSSSSKKKAKEVKKSVDGKELQRGKAKSCRWDLKPYFNNRPTHKEPEAYVCQAMMVAMAVETMYAMRNKPAHPYDISVQAILDCYTPEKCLHKEGEPKDRTKLEGCAPREILHKMTNFDEDDTAYAIYLHANDYHKQLNHPKSDFKQNCHAPDSDSHKWAKGYFNYKMWFSKEHLLSVSELGKNDKDKKQQTNPTKKEKQKNIRDGANKIDSRLNQDRKVYDKSKTTSLQVMMNLLRNGPFIAVTKISQRLERYKLDNEDDLNDLSRAFDTESDPGEKMMESLTHDFFVIGYVKPAQSDEIYFLVKTCIFREKGGWGWQGKGFMKMKTASGGPYHFNQEIYQVMPSNTKPNPSPTPSVSSHSGTHSS